MMALETLKTWPWGFLKGCVALSFAKLCVCLCVCVLLLFFFCSSSVLTSVVCFESFYVRGRKIPGCRKKKEIRSQSAEKYSTINVG